MSRSQLSVAVCFAILFAIIGIHTLLGSHALNGIPVGNPYIDASQIVPYPGTSFYHQTWRGWMETVPATKFLSGIGVNYDPGNIDPTQDDSNMQYLASIGVHNIRIPFTWGSIDAANENQQTASAASRKATILANAKKLGMKPVINIEAYDGDPQPAYPKLTATLVGTPKPGDNQITVSGVKASDITVHKLGTTNGTSGIDGGGSGSAIYSTFITAVTTNTDGSLTLGLSKPLADNFKPGAKGTVAIGYFKYMPLFPVGTPEFNNTMAGWMNYVKVVDNTVKAAGITNYDLEIWNELSFGSAFVTAGHYYATDQDDPICATDKTGLAHGPAPYNRPCEIDADKTQAATDQGGRLWELANQTTQYIKGVDGSNVNVIWGFSNSCPTCNTPNQLPPHTDGDSSHIYGTSLDTFVRQHTAHDNPDALKQLQANLVDGPYVPDIQRAVPEGASVLGVNKIENIFKYELQPKNRESKLPPGTTNYLHYMTEDGFGPGSNGAALPDKAANQMLKAKAIPRGYSFWLNKGLDQYDLYSAFTADAHADNDGGYNLLAAGSKAGGDPTTPQSKALGNLTKQFAGATILTQPRQLGVTVSDVTPNDDSPAYQVFPADKPKDAGGTGEPALNYREMFQFLPFQVTNSKFVISTYVMSWNIYKSLPPMDFQVDITNVNGNKAQVSYHDTITDKDVPVTIISKSDHDIVVDIESMDYVRTLTIDESGDGGQTGPPPDTTPPTTAISSGPAVTTASTDASFSFSGTDDTTPAADLTFLCQLDKQAYSPCTSAKAYSDLAVGVHTFSVKATDAASNTTTTPASQSWTITGTPKLVGDLDGDGHVTGHDVSILLAHYGTHYPPAEFDGGSVVEGHDLSILMGNYGK